MKPLAAFASALAFTLAATAFPAAAQEEAAAAEAPMSKGQELFVTCSACHGADGGTPLMPVYPSLAGQFPEYLMSQFLAFKSGVRQDESMQPFADMTSEEDAREAIAWVSTQKPKVPEATVTPEDAAAGGRIFRGGIVDRRIPSCAACHGPDGSGIAVQYPRIAGQNADYTIKQLTAFRDGTRTTNQVMANVAAKMNDKEIKAVANYIASLR